MDHLTQHTLLDYALTIVVTLLASSGFWAFFEYKLRRKDVENDQRTQQLELLRGLAHDRIIYLGMHYIERGYITHAEFENLDIYLYKPYVSLGGNGSAERILKEVRTLPMRKNEVFKSEEHKGEK